MYEYGAYDDRTVAPDLDKIIRCLVNPSAGRQGGITRSLRQSFMDDQLVLLLPLMALDTKAFHHRCA